MQNAIFFALYFPSLSKDYVLNEIIGYFKSYCPGATIYVGIQGNSILETEALLDSVEGLTIKYKRVAPSMIIDSDASAFLAALEAYKEDGCPEYNLCYFCHSKAITSNKDHMRKEMYDLLFSDVGPKKFEAPEVGSYGPYITFTSVPVDIHKLRCMSIFNPSCMYEPMQYYYINTFFIIRGSIVKNFIVNAYDTLFTTPIWTYSDRWLFERDFSHIADMMGYFPSYQLFHGNYSTNYKAPTAFDFEEKLALYKRTNNF